MKTLEIDNFLANLTKIQRNYLLDKLKVAVLGETTNPIPKVCTCCGLDNFIKHSYYKGVPKFKCKTTGKIFSYKSKTVLSGIVSLEKLSSLLELMVVKKIAYYNRDTGEVRHIKADCF